MRIKKGDTVIVITGNDKGVTGEVIRVIPKEKRIVVSGVNVRKKHQKPRPGPGGRQTTQGGIIEFEAPIDVSNVMLVCPHTGQPTRIGIRREANEDGSKAVRVRYSKKSGEDID